MDKYSARCFSRLPLTVFDIFQAGADNAGPGLGDGECFHGLKVLVYSYKYNNFPKVISYHQPQTPNPVFHFQFTMSTSHRDHNGPPTC